MEGMVPEKSWLGAVEGGGTWMRCAVGDSDGHIAHHTAFKTSSPAETFEGIVSFFKQHPVQAIGVGIFGPLDRRAGRITTTPKSGWSHTDVLRPLRSGLDVPVIVDTDVHAAAIGEHHHGAGQQHKTTVYLTIGTGVGGALLHDGVPVAGLLHPEMGHMAVNIPQTEQTFLGTCPFHANCIEGRISGPALARRWSRPAEQLSADHPVWEYAAGYLSEGLRNIMALCSPDVVILGGGVGRNPHLHRALHSALDKQLSSYWPTLSLRDWLVVPALGDRSALVGALHMAATCCP